MTHSDLESLVVTDLDAGTVFSGQASGRMIKGFHAAASRTPPINPHYVFPDTIRDLVVWFMQPSDPLYLFGPTGSGKTSLIHQVAARLNYPVFDVTGHGRLEFADLTGHLSLDQASMRFEYGPLALAMHYGGLFLLNEMDLLDPATATGLNGVLDGLPLCLAENGGEVIPPHPMFRFIATANTNGASDETGLYQGTLRQNLVFMDRFWICEVPYPAEDTELALLSRTAAALPDTLRKGMVAFANHVRTLFTGEAEGQDRIDITFSTRTLLRWADLTLRFQPLAQQGIPPVLYALDRALGLRAHRSTRALLHELSQRIFA